MTIPAYAIGYLREVDFGPEIIDYMRRIDATLAPYGGRFLVHGSRLTPLEGEWPGDVVVIAFPDRDAAEDWYASDGYRAILPLRTGHAHSMTAIVDGVPEGYAATDTVARLLAGPTTA